MGNVKEVVSILPPPSSLSLTDYHTGISEKHTAQGILR